MKKKILSLITAFLCAVICFSGCSLGSFIENGANTTPNGGNNTTKPDNGTPPSEEQPEEDLKTHYRVSVIYNNQPFSPGDKEVTAVWRNDTEIKRVELAADGTADAGVLEGDFSVYLEGLPEKYTYNPNGYTATEDGRFVSILLTDIMQPANASSADGKDKYVNLGCYKVKFDGTYRAVLSGEKVNNEEGVLFYEYAPTAAGWYSITSNVNVYDDEINPLIDVWGGSMAFKWYDRTIDGGGVSLSGGFTKNFRHEIRISEREVGGSFSFAIHAVNKSGKYPVYVDFTIKYEGEYKSSYDNVKVVVPQENRVKAANPKINEAFVWANLGTRTFDMANYRYNDATKRYHYYNMDLYGDNSLGYGKGFGPYLLCAIRPAIPSYTITTLYNANAVLNPETGTSSNFLQLYNIWFEDEQAYGTLDYTDFIRSADTGYARYCNDAGYCYVTQELMEFLHLYADNHSLYNDGIVMNGSPEDNGYYAEEDSLWLFACGFYFVGGTDGLNSSLNAQA